MFASSAAPFQYVSFNKQVTFQAESCRGKHIQIHICYWPFSRYLLLTHSHCICYWPILTVSVTDPFSRHLLLTHFRRICYWLILTVSVADPFSPYLLLTHSHGICCWPTCTASVTDPFSRFLLLTNSLGICFCPFSRYMLLTNFHGICNWPILTASSCCWPILAVSVADPFSRYLLLTHSRGICYWQILTLSVLTYSHSICNLPFLSVSVAYIHILSHILLYKWIMHGKSPSISTDPNTPVNAGLMGRTRLMGRFLNVVPTHGLIQPVGYCFNHVLPHIRFLNIKFCWPSTMEM